jgi:hypothetical protein
LPKGTELISPNWNKKPGIYKICRTSKMHTVGDGLNDAGAYAKAMLELISENVNVFSPACDAGCQ